ncbi:hypothetical protein ACFPM7_23500 [Actinokineospora guangxiensis]|uniref:PE-PGRS family protein n=1 Tax=Actinokineospora guangxiensis TaxID=1490288 RepID=A0ABW0EVU5_9PSEU
MRRWDPLNERQLAILKHVASGGDLGVVDAAAKRSARALYDRGLIELGQQGRWNAGLTQAGRFYLDRGVHPDHPSAAPTGKEPRPPQWRVRPSRAPAPTQLSTQRLAAATDLIDELTQGRGRREICLADAAAVAAVRKTVDFAKRHRLVPSGKRLEMRTRSGLLQIRLEDGVHLNARGVILGGLVPVQVPTQLRGMHQVVEALRADHERLVLAGDERRRALLLLHGLTQEAVRRGYFVRTVSTGADRLQRRVPNGVIDLEVGDDVLTVAIASTTIRGPAPAVGGLAVEVWEASSHRMIGRWADRRDCRAEDGLASLLKVAEDRAATAERERAELHHQWQEAVGHAKREVARDFLAREIKDQAHNWHEARRLHAYCDALEEAIRYACGPDECDIESAWAWLDWARDYADGLDPLSMDLPGMTPPPEPRPADLEPYLDGWSPYEPARQSWRTWRR